jgi:hypothetical protein
MGKRSKEAQARRRDKRNAKLDEIWRVRRETDSGRCNFDGVYHPGSKSSGMVGVEEGK